MGLGTEGYLLDPSNIATRRLVRYALGETTPRPFLETNRWIAATS
jgi:hypothetical protein